MSSSPSHLIANDPAWSQLCDPPESPDVKKVKIDQADTATNKDTPPTSTRMPSSAFHSRPSHRKRITPAPKFDYPSSAVKVTGSNLSSITLCGTLGAESEYYVEDQPENCGEAGMEIAPQEERSMHEYREPPKSVLIELVSAEQSALAQNEENAVIQIDSSTGAEGVSLSTEKQQEMEASDIRELLSRVSEDSAGGNSWEELPFFESDEVDGSIVSSELATGSAESSKAASKDANEGSVSEQNQKRKWRKKSKKLGEEKEKVRKPPPNAFVAVRIASPDIRAKVEQVQEGLLAKDERLKATLVTPTRNHITLMVTRLNHKDTEEIEKYAVVYSLYMLWCMVK